MIGFKYTALLKMALKFTKLYVIPNITNTDDFYSFSLFLVFFPKLLKNILIRKMFNSIETMHRNNSRDLNLIIFN